MSPAPILALQRLRPAEFVGRIPSEYKDTAGLIVLRERFERDFALTHLVAANCACDPERPDAPSNFVVKGGFALRHLYDSVRYSKDADFAMSGSDLEIVGHPDDLALPPGMTIASSPLTASGEVFKVKIEYRTTENRRDFIFCDLNSNERPIHRQPPQARDLKSFFADPFPVWASQLDEIIGEKLFAFIDLGLTRIKDVYDLHHVLRDRSLVVTPDNASEVYERFRKTRRTGPPFTGLPSTFQMLLSPDHRFGATYEPSEEAETAWEAEVGDHLPRPDLTAVSTELFDLMTERLQMTAPA